MQWTNHIVLYLLHVNHAIQIKQSGVIPSNSDLTNNKIRTVSHEVTDKIDIANDLFGKFGLQLHFTIPLDYVLLVLIRNIIIES